MRVAATKTLERERGERERENEERWDKEQYPSFWCDGEDTGQSFQTSFMPCQPIFVFIN